MKILSALIVVLSGLIFSFGQNEQSPIVEKALEYKDWTLKNLNGGETNLRQFAKGKKLVMVVYWAPWCANWAHDAPFVEELYKKYSKDGLGVIGVGQYDPVGNMKKNYEKNNLTFPSVYESTATSERLTTVHYSQRTAAGDTRKWGSPWYVFLDPSMIEPAGDKLSNKVQVVNGELIRHDAEKFIREKLGLAARGSVADIKSKEIEVCDPAKPTTLTKP